MSIRQPLQSKRELTSSTVTGVKSFPRHLSTESWLGTLTHRTVCRGRMGRDHSLKQSQSPALLGLAKHAIPGVVCHVSMVGSREKEDPAPSKDLLYPWFFLFLLFVIPASPWSIKGRAGHPTQETDHFLAHKTWPSSNRALGVLLTFPSRTWDLSFS